MSISKSRDVGTKPKIIDGQTMQRISYCRVRFGHCGRSFISPETYKSELTKRVVISGAVFRVSGHFCNVSIDDVHLMQLPS